MEQDNLNQLKKLAKVFNTDNVITSNEIEQVLSGILSIMSSFKKDNENLTKETRDYVNELLDKVIEERKKTLADVEFKLESNSKDIEKLKESNNLSLDSKISEINKIRDEIMSSKPQNGKDADQELIVEKVIEQIKLPEYKEYLLSGENVVEEINKLSVSPEFQIDAAHIKNLPDTKVIPGGIRRLALLNDVNITDPTNAQVLSYDSTTKEWKNTTGGGGSSITLKTNNVDNGSQSILNLKQGANITLTDDGVGGVTIDAAGGSGTPGGSTTQLQYNNAGAFGGISGATTNGTAVTFTTGNLLGADVKASSSAGLQLLSNSGTVTALLGAGGGANSTFYGGTKLDYSTASTIAIIDSSKNLISADTTTYPSLTELSYVKGVTSSIQTQINSKQATLTLGTGVQTALGVNVGTAGAFVVNGGALGTPSSGTVTNLTGTASININGTVGATTPSTGAFTTISIGTLNYSPSNALITSQQSVNSYSQNIIQNTSTGATASSDYIVNNSLSTDTTFYGDFGMNSSGFTGASVFNQPSYVYLTSTSTDLAIGTTTAHGMHFVVNGGTTDAMSINSNGVVSAPNIVLGYTTTATAAGTTTLTVSSTRTQIFTGSTTQTVLLPTTNVLQGQQYNIINRSTGLVTVQSSGANTITILGANTSALFTANVATPTTAANWNSQYFGVNAASGKVATINNTITLAGTDAQTYTFPSATTTIGGLGTTQTWTGANTFNNANVLAGAATMAIFNTTATTITAFGAATTLTIGGTPTTAITHNYSTNATAAATTKTVNLGTGGAASSTTNINIGSANGGTTTVNSPTISLGGTTGATTTGTIELGAASDTTLARVAAGIISVEGEVMNGYATTATAAGTTTLTITSAKTQYFTGTSTQTVKLPTTSVILGQSYIISNQSTGSVTVQSSGANTIQILGAGMTATFVANTATPTTAAHWNYSMIEYVGLNNAITASSNAATINLAYKTNTVTNNSAATLTITLPTAGAIDGEMRVVRVLDFSAVAQTITWTNTEDSTATAPTTSNGSTTLPKTAGFQYNAATSKWRCTANA